MKSVVLQEQLHCSEEVHVVQGKCLLDAFKSSIKPEMMLLDSGSCALHPSCLPHFSQSIYIAPVCISSWPSPCKGQIQKTHFPGSLAAVSLHQLVPGYVQVGWPHPNPVIMPATFSWMECFLLFFLTLFQHGEIV